MKRLLALFLILVGSILPDRLATAMVYNDDRHVVEAADVILLYYITGSFGALVMIGFGVTSIILALVATTASTRRRGWVIASIVCALLAIGYFVLRSLVNSWFNTTTLG